MIIKLFEFARKTRTKQQQKQRKNQRKLPCKLWSFLIIWDMQCVGVLFCEYFIKFEFNWEISIPISILHSNKSRFFSCFVFFFARTQKANKKNKRSLESNKVCAFGRNYPVHDFCTFYCRIFNIKQMYTLLFLIDYNYSY